jgi:hypothetical protein
MFKNVGQQNNKTQQNIQFFQLYLSTFDNCMWAQVTYKAHCGDHKESCDIR